MERFEPIVAWMRTQWGQAVEIWISGGWAMVGIAAIALVMFSVGTSVQLQLRQKGFLSVRESTWRRWIDHPAERKGPIGDLLEVVADRESIEETTTSFEELRAREIRPFERDLRLMRVCVSAAPLVGLLGTVTGMLATFGALASGSGGDKTMGLVADALPARETDGGGRLSRSGTMGRFREALAEEESETGIDMSPLIDCVFILLIFFIVTTVFVEETGVEVDKPQAASSVQLEKTSILIALTGKGQIVYGGREIGVSGVQPLVKRLLQKEDLPVIIQADQTSQSGLLVRIIDEAKLAGATKVSVATSQAKG
jgi:biopolymer transport protein ExbD